jgi:hypothetical protein
MMNCISRFFLFVSAYFIVPIGYTQTISCSDFSITEVYPDSLNANDYQISIQSTAVPLQIVNYPYVSAVLDCNADTVATGGLFWFGQMGETIQNYPVTLTGNGSMACYPLTVIFIYGLDTGIEDTCFLSYNFVGLNASLSNVSIDLIYPNPSNLVIQLGEIPEIDFRIINTIGQIELIGKTQGVINVEFLNSGAYFLELSDGQSKTILRFYHN